MPAARKAVASIKSVPAAAMPGPVSRPRRTRLTRALAATAKTLEKRADEKTKKAKLLSNRYTIPADEHAQLVALKKRLVALGTAARKSELLRAGIRLLAAMDDTSLIKLVATVEPVGGKARRNGKKRPAAAATSN